jgi:error-prone DNA polymerase
VTIEHHPVQLLRGELRAQSAVSSADLEGLPHGTHVRIGGLVMARQRPGTAKGVCFLLLEDEFGTINLVVPPPVYERDRLVVRSEPLVIAEGTLERFATAGGAINVVIQRMRALEAPNRPLAELHELEAIPAAVGDPRGIPDQARETAPFDSLELARQRALRAAQAEDEEAAVAAAGGGARRAAVARGRGDFRAVAPPVMSFTSGRRR